MYQIFSKEELECMSNEEQLKLDIDFHMAGRTSGVMCFPVRYEEGQGISRGSKENNFPRNVDIAGYDFDTVYDEILIPENDSYVVINTLRQDLDGTGKANIEYINEIYIDLDLYHSVFDLFDSLHREGKMEELIPVWFEVERLKYSLYYHKELIGQLFEDKVIPHPSTFVFTGRGYALHYQYKAPIAVKDQEGFLLHMALYEAIFQKIEEVIESRPEFLDSDIRVDRSVKTIERMARLAGTRNMKGQDYARIISMGGQYSSDELIDLFGINRDDLKNQNTISTIDKKEKKASNKKDKKLDSIKSSRALTEKKKLDLFSMDLLYTKVFTPYAGRKEKNVAAFLLRCLENFFGMRTWIEGSHRDRFLFIVYNSAIILHGSVEAFTIISEYNSKMAEPLSDDAVVTIAKHVINHEEITGLHGDSYYTYYPCRVIDVLEISEEEADRCGLYDNVKRKAQYAKNNESSAELDRHIAEMYLVQGYGYGKIVECLPKGFSCVKKTVGNTLERLGIKGHRGEADLLQTIDFEAKRRYNNVTPRGVNSQLTASHTFLPPHNKEEMLDVCSEKEARCLSTMDKMKSKIAEDSVILQHLIQGDDVCILGPAGCGKGKLAFKEFMAFLQEQQKKKRVLCLAMNGRTASDMPGGRTIHSAFKVSTRVVHPDDEWFVDCLWGVDIIIIDEISQVRNDVFTKLMETITEYEKHYNRRIQVILLGDFLQIPPILRKKEEAIYYRFYESRFAFKSVYWDRFKILLMDGNKRVEDDPVFAEGLAKIRFGSIRSLLKLYNCIDKVINEEAISICPTKVMVRKINAVNMAKLDKLVSISGELVGYVDWDDIPLDDKDIQLAVGMRVMTVVNTKEYKNGMIGTIDRINKKTITVLFDNKARCRVEKYQFGTENHHLLQYPLVPAYAITADKCQGMTLEDVNIYPGYFAAAQLYVALSRCKYLNRIHFIGDCNPEELIVDEEALAYIESLLK